MDLEVVKKDPYSSLFYLRPMCTYLIMPRIVQPTKRFAILFVLFVSQFINLSSKLINSIEGQAGH